MTPDIDAISEALIAGFRRFDPDEQRLVQTIYRLLATGQPASTGRIADESAWPLVDIEARLASWPAVYRNDSGEVVGFGGLTCEPVTDHRIRIERAGTAWAWCAFDPLFIAPVLDVAMDVSSRCPSTGAPITLAMAADGVSMVDPPAAVLTLLTPEGALDDDVRLTFCHYVHFCATADAAAAWTERHPGTFSITVDDAVSVAQRVKAAVFPHVGVNAAATR